MSRTAIHAALRALPPPPLPALVRGYEHAMQYAKFYRADPSAGAARASMQYPQSPADQAQYMDGWLIAGLHLIEEELS
jgi:hypothetical protein